VTLEERLAKLEPRERTLLGGLAVTLGVILFLFMPLYVFQHVGDLRDQNQEIRDYVEKVRDNRAKIDKKKADKDAANLRYSRTMPPLASFIEETSQGEGLAIDESQTRPDIPHGKKYTEHVTSVKFKKVGMLGLVRMMEKIEKSNFPVSISRLNIKPRGPDPDSFDVEMHVSHYERKGDPKKDTPKPKPEESEEEEP
jgi:general secretion pathway protein M